MSIIRGGLVGIVAANDGYESRGSKGKREKLKKVKLGEICGVKVWEIS